MAQPTPRRGHGQFDAASRRFAEASGLPFADLLAADTVDQTVRAEGVRFRDRLYPPAVTVWVFLSQALDAGPPRRWGGADAAGAALSSKRPEARSLGLPGSRRLGKST